MVIEGEYWSYFIGGRWHEAGHAEDDVDEIDLDELVERLLKGADLLDAVSSVCAPIVKAFSTEAARVRWLRKNDDLPQDVDPKRAWDAWLAGRELELIRVVTDLVCEQLEGDDEDDEDDEDD